ncbi:MAG: FecR domain-containing protein [Dysgonamonadaceae bacterium]|jgi:hypothetical protein|nr:FecR domain-containing protein [Dysgonamonadaceae bacterium]
MNKNQSESGRLLQDFLDKTSTTDSATLSNELQKKENAYVRRVLIDLRKMRFSFNVDRAWSRLHASVLRGEQRKRTIRFVFRVAACLLPLAVLAAVLLYERPQPTPVAQEESKINIDRKAYLRTADGETILLSSGQPDTICDIDGLSIVDTGKRLLVTADSANSSVPQYHSVVVPRGGEYSIELADGTTVALNAESELRFPQTFTARKREVFLKGEAYFNVAKNNAKPFVVNVESVAVEVLGTQFNINAYPEHRRVATTLVTGSVRVTSSEANSSTVLLPNQQALCADDGIQVRTVNPADFVSWTHGRFYFEKMPLADILLQMERWYDIHFIWTDEALKTYTFNGALHRDYSAQELLNILGKTTEVRFSFDGRDVTVKKASSM